VGPERSGWLGVKAGKLSGFMAVGDLAPKASSPGRSSPKQPGVNRKNRLFLMGLGMLRLNWADVRGDDIRFRYSDLGLPTDFSTRERASFTLDGTLEGGYTEVDGFLNFDPENRIAEPELEFLVNIHRGQVGLSLGDYRQGVMAQSVFSRYLHPFRGAILTWQTPRLTLEALGGLARGESAVDQMPAELGAGPYYLEQSPVLRGSEVVFLITRSGGGEGMELQRQPLQRGRDYVMDYDRGMVMLLVSLPPSDELGNPRVLEVAYQYESMAGHFTRVVFGMRSCWRPLDALSLSVSYLGDADQSLPLDRLLEGHRGLLGFGVALATKPLELNSELSLGLDPQTDETRTAHLVMATLRPLPHLSLVVNTWALDGDFPVFANRQLQYGFSLMQAVPDQRMRSVVLSPFQFTRNLGAELYPFSMASLALDERETHGVLEWEDTRNRVSAGFGHQEQGGAQRENTYVSALHQGERTVGWFKAGLEADERSVGRSRQYDFLGGVRQRMLRIGKGALFLQADASMDWLQDLEHDTRTRREVYALSTEYLHDQNDLFASVRGERLEPGAGAEDSRLWAVEFGARHPLLAGFFVDSRYRHERTDALSSDRSQDFLGMGLGFERTGFRALARYEVQTNRLAEGENRRSLWSLFLHGSPWQAMTLSLQYYHQNGRDAQASMLTRRGEDQLSLRLLWRPSRTLSLYSQWRYDSNLELLPPLDEIRSSSLATVQGLKLALGERYEILANYKLLRVWGPVQNRKASTAAEIGYRLWQHLRLGVGAEYIDYSDREQPEAEYQSFVGYLKLVLVF